MGNSIKSAQFLVESRLADAARGDADALYDLGICYSTGTEGVGFAVDYLDLADAETLEKPVHGRARRLLAAARLGTTRLIDNLAI